MLCSLQLLLSQDSLAAVAADVLCLSLNLRHKRLFVVGACCPKSAHSARARASNTLVRLRWLLPAHNLQARPCPWAPRVLEKFSNSPPNAPFQCCRGARIRPTVPWHGLHLGPQGHSPACRCRHARQAAPVELQSMQCGTDFATCSWFTLDVPHPLLFLWSGSAGRGARVCFWRIASCNPKANRAAIEACRQVCLTSHCDYLLLFVVCEAQTRSCCHL